MRLRFESASTSDCIERLTPDVNRRASPDGEQRSDIVTFVGRDEVAQDAPGTAIGQLGRSRRQRDVAHLRVLHVEDNRRAG